jgi:hypothetical protein
MISNPFGDKVKKFHDAFVADLPPGAETGSYAASAHDRFHRKRYGINGHVEHGEWSFRFAEGKFIDAVHAHRAGAILGDTND